MTTPDLTEFDQPSTALNVLSAACPPLGLLIYLSLVGKLPRQAVAAGRSAVHGVAGVAIAYGLICIWAVADGWKHNLGPKYRLPPSSPVSQVKPPTAR